MGCQLLKTGKQTGQGDPLSRAAILERLAALNRATAPFRIIDCRLEGVDLITEWKIADTE